MNKPRSDIRGCPLGDSALLHAFLDGELPAARQAALAAHREQCAACAAALQRAAEMDRRVGAARPQPTPLSAAASRALLDRALAEAGVRRGGRGRGWLAPAWGFAATLVVAASGIALHPWGPAVAILGGTVGTQVARLPGAGIRPLADDRPPRSGRTVRGSWTSRIESGTRGARLPGPKGTGLSRESRLKPAGELHGLSRPQSRSRPVPQDRLVVHGQGATPRGFGVSFLVSMNYERGVRRHRPRRGVTAQYQRAETPGYPDAGTAVLPESDSANAADPLASREPAVWPANANAETGVLAAAEPAPQQDADPAANPQPPVPRLLVLVTSEPAPSPLAVTEAPENAPSYARAIALRPDANGGTTWTQATASDDGTGQKLALVMLGTAARPLGEDN